MKTKPTIAGLQREIALLQQDLKSRETIDKTNRQTFSKFLGFVNHNSPIEIVLAQDWQTLLNKMRSDQLDARVSIAGKDARLEAVIAENQKQWHLIRSLAGDETLLSGAAHIDRTNGDTTPGAYLARN